MIGRFFLPLVLAFAASFGSPFTVSAEPDKPVSFARQILPILSDKCFVCHGPDSQHESDLRLDTVAEATRDRGGYRAVDPQSPEKSELLRRILSTDDPMPPEDAEKPLTDAERKLLEQWIRQGGQYEQHWAFTRPTKHIRPAKEAASTDDQHTDRARFKSLTDAIDGFVGSELAKRGVDFAPIADRSVLARRASLVLTGLPPEPELLDRFLRDSNADAYEKFVDQLLASPSYGEHQARYWLDAIRYGDTHGLHLDNRRGIYPYRDWIITALNQNLPLDKFITWQLAGDLLPDPSLEQLVATGYVRMNPSTGEGGAIADEFQAKNNFDRVETFGTVFLGMSLTCARCHNHKYDPIEQDEYYRLFAFFNNTAEPPLDGNSYTYGPTVRVPADQPAWLRWQQLESESDSLLSDVKDSADVDQWLAYARARVGWKHDAWRMTSPSAVASSPPSLDEPDQGPEQNSDNGPSTEDAPTDVKASPWSPVKAFPGTLGGKQAGKRIPKADQMVWIAFQLHAPAAMTIDLAVVGAGGMKLVIDGEIPTGVKETVIGARRTLRIPIAAAEHEIVLGLIGTKDSKSLEIQIDHPWDALARQGDWDRLPRENQLRILSHAEGDLIPESIRSAAQRLDHAIELERSNFTTSLIAKELPKPRETRRLKRGEYDMPVGDPLIPDTLRVMSTFPSDAPRNRLGLARWLTSPEHPLVTRVLVNRIWQRTFGRPLVATPEDFGLQGQQPSHPELLDWMAVELIDNGWNLKQLLRDMVTSRTFKQQSNWRTDLDDPENQWYARGSSYRLDAEVLRDIGLWASGLMDHHMGGEGIKPYQPPGMWAALAHPASNTKQYVPDHGARLYRRTVYVYWKRTSPHPMMTLFDAPDRESSCVRRSRTNTPLQSLGLFNETQRVEMARALAEQLIQRPGDDSQKLNHLYRMLACRDANKTESQTCLGLLRAARERFLDRPDSAKQFIQVGEAPLRTQDHLADVAAWTQVCLTVLASDTAILVY